MRTQNGNLIDRLKERLRNNELERPAALVTEILGELNVALLEGHGSLMRSSNGDEFAQALAALHATLAEHARPKRLTWIRVVVPYNFQHFPEARR